MENLWHDESIKHFASLAFEISKSIGTQFFSVLKQKHKNVEIGATATPDPDPLA
jgi:hypothetical protein